MSVGRRAPVGGRDGGVRGQWAAAICIAAVVFTSLAAQVSGLSGQYVSPDCVPSSSCPSVSWSVAASLDGNGNFTVTSSANRTGNSNYVSFAFANGTEMENALFVIDCYEPNGTIAMGTSVNTHVNGTNNNVDSPSYKSLLSNVVAMKGSSTLTCSFALNYSVSTLYNGSFYLFLAEGTMNTSQVASPQKNVHTRKFVSASNFSVLLRGSGISSTASPISSSTKTSAATVSQAWPALTFACFVSAIKKRLL